MNKKDNPFQGMALTSAILAQLVGGPLVGIYIGNWLDKQFNSDPLFLVLFLLVGIGAGTYGTVEIVKEYIQK